MNDLFVSEVRPKSKSFFHLVIREIHLNIPAVHLLHALVVVVGLITLLPFLQKFLGLRFHALAAELQPLLVAPSQPAQS
jgi:hypothetical protein